MFFFLSYLSIFPVSAFPSFSIPSSFFLLFNPIHCFSFFVPSFSLCIKFWLFVILFLLFLCLIFFGSFSHLSLQTFLFHSFELSFRCDIVRSLFLFIYLYLFCVCHCSELSFRFFFHAAIIIEKFGQTCMIKEQSEIPAFARSLLHRAVTLYVRTITCATWFRRWLCAGSDFFFPTTFLSMAQNVNLLTE